MADYPYFFTWANQSSPTKIEFESNEDHFFVLKNGHKVYDLSSISFQASFGLNNEKIKEAIKKQLDSFSVVSPKAIFPLKDQATYKLLSHLDGYKRQINALDGKVFYTLSGAESVENALKMARQIKKKNVVLCRERSYHGASLGALSVTGDWRNQPHQTVDEWTTRIPEPHNDPFLTQTELIIKDVGPENIAAFCLETITGGNGVIIPPESWWQGIQRLCDQYNIFLILDEVICGFQRTGRRFGFHNYPFLKPHFICMSKGITGGYIPFGAVWANRDIVEFYNENVLSCGLTSYAHPLGLAAMDAICDILADGHFLENIVNLKKMMKGYFLKWEELPNVKEIRTIGLLAAIEFTSDVTLDFNYFLERGVHLVVQPQTLILSPALTFNKMDLQAALETLNKALREL
tara:strand:+ start:4024 stop:5238 length:1215 start_codon:yes stop_codon:yes gene_type:complete